MDESTKSDEEYDDLAMEDAPDDGYMSDDDREFFKLELNGRFSISGDLSSRKCLHGDKYKRNLDLFLRMRHEPLLHSLMSPFASPSKDKNERRPTSPGMRKLTRRSLSIPSFVKHG